MTAEIIYQGSKRTSLQHLKSGQTIENDAPTDNNGKGERFSPTDLLASSLASCMLTIMGIKAEQMGLEDKLVGSKANVLKTMAADPRRVSQVDIEIQFAQSLGEKDRKILEAAARACPVAKSLHPDLKQNITFK